MKISNREKRDWSLLIFIVPIGIFLMMIAGQIAIRIDPNWSVDAGMQSNLELKAVPQEQIDLIQPLLPDILTPLSWFDTFLTPNSNSDGNYVFPPFIIFEATATPSPSPSAAATTTTTVTATATSTPPTSTATATATATKKPPEEDTSTPPPAVCTDPTAMNNGDPLPCTYPPTTCTDPFATNNGGLLPCLYPAINVGAPNGIIGTISDGARIVINLSPSPIIVNGPSDTNYDFVYYEQPAGIGVLMDKVILSISTDNITYYVVFNWGDGIPDTNSNVGDVAATTGTEYDNQPIDSSELYGTTYDTGILVDVDNAPSNPPLSSSVGPYNYLAIQAPNPPPPPPLPATPEPNDGTVGLDSVQVTEVPSPWP